MDPPRDLPTQQAPTRVWADVGGTFTDCFVIDSAGMRVKKVLSSGVMRATIVGRPERDSLQLDLGRRDTPDDFWTGAQLSLLDAGDTPHVVGTIRHDHAASRRVRIAETNFSLPAECAGRVVELDANLEAPVLATRLLLGIPLSPTAAAVGCQAWHYAGDERTVDPARR